MIHDLKEKDKRAFNFIRNKLIHSGERPTLSDINAVTGGKSPRSASLVVNRLIKAGLIEKVGRQFKLGAPGAHSVHVSTRTVMIPLVGTVPCGSPMLAEQNIETRLPVSTELAKKGFSYFLLRATGDSMDKAGIKKGNILLVRQQETADNGDKVVALIDDEATVKIFEKTRDAIILRPRSSNRNHKPIILTNNCKIQGVVVATLPKDLY